jgi:hypothetical protein
MRLVALGPPFEFTPVNGSEFETIHLLHDEAIFCRTSNRKGEPGAHDLKGTGVYVEYKAFEHN